MFLLDSAMVTNDSFNEEEEAVKAFVSAALSPDDRGALSLIFRVIFTRTFITYRKFYSL